MITIELDEQEAYVLQRIAARLRNSNSIHPAAEIAEIKKKQASNRRLFVRSMATSGKSWEDLARAAVGLGLYSKSVYLGDIVYSLERIAREERVFKTINQGCK